MAATERSLACLVLTIASGLLLATSAEASNATLAVALDKWSNTIGADARSISVAARQRHPRLMTASALRFRRDALRAHAAFLEQHPSSAAGRRAKGLALGAFANYAMAGKRWAASGRARLAHRRIRARSLAGSARTFAKRGNRLLIVAGKLLS